MSLSITRKPLASRKRMKICETKERAMHKATFHHSGAPEPRNAKIHVILSISQPHSFTNLLVLDLALLTKGLVV